MLDTDNELLLKYAANGLARVGRLPSDQIIERVLASHHASSDLVFEIVAQGTDKQLGLLLERPNRSDRLGFLALLDDRIRDRPELVEKLIESEAYYLMTHTDWQVEAAKRAFKSGEAARIRRALDAAKEFPSERMMPLLLTYKDTAHASRAIAACATKDWLPELARRYKEQKGRAGALPEIILRLDPSATEAQELFLSLSSHYDVYYSRIAAQGLGYGSAKEVCKSVLRRMLEEDRRLEPEVRVSLFQLGDPESGRWIKRNLPKSLPALAILPPDIDLDFVRPALKEYSSDPGMDLSASLDLAAKRPELFTQEYFLRLMEEDFIRLKESEPHARVLGFRNLKDARRIESFTRNEDEEEVKIVGLVRLAELGDEEGLKMLKDFASTIRTERSDLCRTFFTEVLRLDDIGFLEPEWLDFRYLRSRYCSHKLDEEFRSRLHRDLERWK